MSEEVSHWGIHRSSNPRHSPSTEAHSNNDGNSELHARDIDQANIVESVGALYHSDARNPCSQGRPTAGGMELDDFQKGFFPISPPK
nr:hypothetical protein CFP56_48179 [Quercus suber]